MTKGTPIGAVESGTTKKELQENGLKIVNIVGSLNLDTEMNLETIANKISKTEYNPDIYQNLIYDSPRSKTAKILVLPSGYLFIVGSKSVDEVVNVVTNFVDSLDKIYDFRGIEIDIRIQNILVTGDLGFEIDVTKICTYIGLENVEYNPEQFPGAFIPTQAGGLITLYRTGKFTIGGCKSFNQVKKSYCCLLEMLPEELLN